MSFHFRIGARVVCVNITPRRDGLHPRYRSTMIPRLGGVYTIRDIFDASVYGHDEAGLLLEEIVNPVRRYISQAGPVEVEQFWLGFRFRPLRTTSIEVFRKMLEPEPAREKAVIEFVGWATEKAALLREAGKLLDAEARRVANLPVDPLVETIHLGAPPEWPGSPHTRI